MSLNNFEILIIDDDPSHIQLVKKILENVGAYVSHCSDMESGMQLIRDHHPHLVLLDLMLETEFSFDFLENNAKQIREQGTKIIMFSVVQDQRIISKALSYGVDDYICKPLNSKELLETVQAHLFADVGMKYVFEEDTKVTARVKGEIARFNEFEFVVQCPVKIDRGEDVGIASNFVDLKNEGTVKFVSKGNSIYIENGLYETHLNIVGASNELLQKIYKLKKVRTKA